MAFVGGRGGLAGGQAVNLVVHNDISEVQISPHGVDEMIQADAIAVSVAARDDHVQVMIGKLGAACHGDRAAVEAVDAVGVEKARQIRGTANPRNHENVLGRELQLLGRNLERTEHAEIAASGAPVRLDNALVGFQRQFNYGRHKSLPFVLQFRSTDAWPIKFGRR